MNNNDLRRPSAVSTSTTTHNSLSSVGRRCNVNYKVGDVVTVRAPATTANLGCGFDVFGLALDLWLALTVKVVSHEFSFVFIGQEIDPNLPTDDSNAIVLAFLVGLRHLRASPPVGVNFEFICANAVPVGRGLGSSATAIVAGLGAAFVLCGRSLEDIRTLREISILACRREGHPDNVLPAIFGNMQIGVIRTTDDVRLCLESDECGIGDYIMQKVPFPSDDLECLIYVPRSKLSTSQARKLLPEKYDKSDVVSNVGRASILVAALLLKDYANLKFAMEDKMHQPYRQDLCPGYEILKNASGVTDALALYISGAGPSVVTLCRQQDTQTVLEDYMTLCSSYLEDEGKFIVCKVSDRGVEACSKHLSRL